MNLQNVQFVRSAAQPDDFVLDGLPQIAFTGKSNVGKSSVLNCLLRRKNFARVGQRPGKTIHVNYFLIDQKAYFVDLPGYGYAQVAAAEKERWGRLMNAFFARAEQLTLSVMIVDARHAPTKLDCVMADLLRESNRPFLVVANKLDKLKKSELELNMRCIRQTLRLPEEIALLPFSAEKGDGREALLSAILQAIE